MPPSPLKINLMVGSGEKLTTLKISWKFHELSQIREIKVWVFIVFRLLKIVSENDAAEEAP